MKNVLESLVGLHTIGRHSGWIESLREDALANFLEQGLPTRRLENWKGTNFAPLAALNFVRVGPPTTPDELRDDSSIEANPDQHELV